MFDTRREQQKKIEEENQNWRNVWFPIDKTKRLSNFEQIDKLNGEYFMRKIESGQNSYRCHVHSYARWLRLLCWRSMGVEILTESPPPKYVGKGKV